MRCLLLFAVLALAGGCASFRAGGAGPAREAAEIRRVLERQVEAWNRHDLPGFMEGYANTDSLRFFSNGRLRRGWAETLESMRRGYPDPAAMGTLRFEELDVRVLSPGWASVTGRFRIDRASDAPTGLFTLLVQKRPEGWRVVQDHTSGVCE